jgi:long-chain acyl-CoA synthetase
MATYAEKPWQKKYTCGPYPIPKSKAPYPEISLPELLDRSAFSYPDRPAIFFMGKVMTYRELKLQVDKLATALANLGVKKGDKVATVLANCPQFVMSDFAIMKIGGIHVPCSVLHKGPDLVYEIGESESKVVICQDSSFDLVKSIAHKTKLEKFIVTSQMEYGSNPSVKREIPGAIHFLDLMEEFEPEPPEVEINPKEDLSDIVFTGGATGLPKGVMKTHFNRVTNLVQSFGWALEPLAPGIKGKTSILIPVPLFHDYGHWGSHFCIYWGLQMILLPDPRDADMLKEALERFRPLICTCVPTQYTRVLPKGLKRTHTVFCSAAQALPPEVGMEVERQTGMPVTEAYGLTEVGPISHINLSSLAKVTGFAPQIKRESIGVPIADVDVKIVDPDTGEEVSQGKEGEIWIHGPAVMVGYWPEPGRGLKDGWLPTGDIGRMDEEGYFYLTDRIKDMANVSGLKVYTRLVDDVIFELPAVGDAVTIGIPDPERPGSERLKAFIRAKKGYEGKLSPEEVIEHCKTKLPPYAIPRFVEIGTEELPLTVTEKLFKRELREREIKKMRERGEIR